MSSPPDRSGLLNASGFRLAAFYAALLAIAFAATAIIVWFSATAAAENALRQKIELEADALAHELEAEGPGAVKAAIAARMERPGAPEYWLTDSSGTWLIGDAPAMEGPNGWRKVRFARSDEAEGAEGAEELLILTRSFPNGMRLSVGEDRAKGRRIVDTTIFILAQVGAASILLVLLVGYWTTRNSLRRLHEISDTLERVSGGNLVARAPVRRNFFLGDLERVSEGINRMLDRNEALVGGLRRVTRDIAHDLRTPLTHLRQRIEQARDAEGSAKDDAIAVADDKAGQIVRTFDAILRLSEIEAGSAIARFKPVDLSEIAETLFDAYRPDAEQAGGAITIEAARPALVDGDRDLLLQAGANLIENALKHAPAGSAIRIVVAPSPHPAIAVVDNGAGVPAGEIEKVLEPFYRCDQSRTTSGAGLGLSIVKAIAELHGAGLRLENSAAGFRATINFEKKESP